jgi:hypothetical protein
MAFGVAMGLSGLFGWSFHPDALTQLLSDASINRFSPIAKASDRDLDMSGMRRRVALLQPTETSTELSSQASQVKIESDRLNAMDLVLPRSFSIGRLCQNCYQRNRSA